MSSFVCASDSFVVPLCLVALAFNCVGPVAEEHYLRSDMSVLCYKGDHVSAMVVSGILGVLWAFAAPAAVTWMGGRRPETHTDPRFKFLFRESLLLYSDEIMT
jgi:hypothetical protein